jgi:hypothetical protein
VTRNYNSDGRMPIAVPWNAEHIPAHDWPSRPQADVNHQGNAFRPAVIDAMQMYPCWRYRIASKRLVSHFLRTLDARDINEAITHYRVKFGDDAISSIELHIAVDVAQEKAALLKHMDYERAIALESSGFSRCEELAFLTTHPRLFKRDTTE